MRIIRPRVEEILELVRDRLAAAGHAAHAGRRLVLTGGASQLTGLPELARAIISNQARIGRPLGVDGLPELAKSPAFATAVGLLVYPQVAGLEHFEPGRAAPRRGAGRRGLCRTRGAVVEAEFLTIGRRRAGRGARRLELSQDQPAPAGVEKMRLAMSINLKAPELRELKPRIMVCGVGGAGGNAVNNMIVSGLVGVDFIVANTDAQALSSSRAERIIQMGLQVTEGLGAGSKPEVGRAAAEEAIEEIRDHLAGAHMVFVTAGMGGGTGTGAAPVIARVAREMGILTVGVVTKPFHFEGGRRMRLAEGGIAELHKSVDTLIIIPNQNLFRVANEKTTFADAFAMADQVLYSGVACITDLMVKEGLINLDFADVRSIMSEMGKAMMGTGEATGERRAVQAAEAAIANPLLDEVSMKGARGLLDLHHRRQRPHALRGRRSREPHPPGSGRGSQHHSGRDLRFGARRRRSRVGRRDRHRPGADRKSRTRGRPRPGSRRPRSRGRHPRGRCRRRSQSSPPANRRRPSPPRPSSRTTPWARSRFVRSRRSSRSTSKRPPSEKKSSGPRNSSRPRRNNRSVGSPACRKSTICPSRARISSVRIAAKSRRRRQPPKRGVARCSKSSPRSASAARKMPLRRRFSARSPAAPVKPSSTALHAEYGRPSQRPGTPRPAQGQLDPHGRAAPRPAPVEDDQLEIPAFLRRQAAP